MKRGSSGPHISLFKVSTPRGVTTRIARIVGLIDRLYTYLLNINITETYTERIKSSDDEEFRIFKLKLP